MASRLTVNGQSEMFGPRPIELDDKLKQAYGELEFARERYEYAILNVAALKKQKFLRDAEEHEARLRLAMTGNVSTWSNW